MAQNTTATDEPLPEENDERQAIRSELEDTDMYILRYYGHANAVFVVERESPPPTEYAIEGESIIAIDWDNDGYTLSEYRGGDLGGQSSWEIVEEMITHPDTRTEAAEKAEKIIHD